MPPSLRGKLEIEIRQILKVIPIEIARRIIIVSIKNYIKIKYYTLIYRTDFI